MSPSPYIVIGDEFKGFPLESFCVSPNLAKDLEMVLIPGGLVQDRIERLACDIAIDIANDPFIALCVLKGGYQFFGDLLDKIRMLYRYRSSSSQVAPDTPDTNISDSVLDHSQQITVEFIRVKSYENDASSGNVRIIGIESLDSLRGKNVLIVEDIIDTGKTMVKLLQLLSTYQPKSVKVTSLFLKRTPLSNKYKPDYIGFEVPNKFIVGCNLDYNEYFRDLNHVCVINEQGKKRYSTKHE